MARALHFAQSRKKGAETNHSEVSSRFIENAPASVVCGSPLLCAGLPPPHVPDRGSPDFGVHRGVRETVPVDGCGSVGDRPQRSKALCVGLPTPHVPDRRSPDFGVHAARGGRPCR